MIRKAAARGRWKEYWIGSYDSFHELSSRWQSSSRAFGDGRFMFFEGGSQHVTTNLSERDVRRLVGGAFRLPEPLVMHDDDEVLAELLADHGVTR